MKIEMGVAYHYDIYRDTILEGDCFENLSLIPHNTVDCVITSPPYFGLRDYQTARWEGGDKNCSHRKANRCGDSCATGHSADVQIDYYRDICGLCGAKRIDSQIGLEETPEEYIAKIVKIFDVIYRILKKTGTVWLNLGDTYGTGSGGSATNSEKQKSNGGTQIEPRKGTMQKQLLGIPWRVALALQSQGWILRQDIIWNKPNPMPESVDDRCTKAHEYIFLMTKSTDYYYDNVAIQEEAEYDGRKDTKMKGSNKYTASFMPDDSLQSFHTRPHERWPNKNEDGVPMRNKRSVWTVCPSQYKNAHFATFPEELIVPCILAGCPQYVCGMCGKPVVRVTERVKAKRTNKRRFSSKDNKDRCDGENFFEESYIVTTGWKQSCTCSEPISIEKGIVFDPFMGSGTVAAVAKKWGRDFIGCELNPDYIKMAQERVQESTGMFA